MKSFTVRLVAMIIVQALALNIFMEIVRWDLFVSAGLSSLSGLLVGLTIYFFQRRAAAAHKGNP